MDSHAFSEPELVAPMMQGEADERNLLTWKVLVLRKGVAEPVDTLWINSRTLPPRKNKSGKVVWKLPDDPTHVPKFGIHEQKRLWDLFKEQKKQRRKKPTSSLTSSTTTTTTSGDPHDPNSNSNPSDEADRGTRETSSRSGPLEEGSAASSASTPDSSRTPLERFAGHNGGGDHGIQTASTSGALNGHPSPVSPPPGFGSTAGFESLTLEEAQKRTSPSHQHQKQPINPPPGLANTASPAPLTPTPASMNGNGYHSGYGSTVAKGPPCSAPSAMPSPQRRPSYFSLASTPEDGVTFPQRLAGLVAHAFLQLISNPGPSSSHGSVLEWLSYYVPTAQSTLIMGTAQAVARTVDERHRQWHSLSSASSIDVATHGGDPNVNGRGSGVGVVGGKRWECHGWTAQYVDRHAEGVHHTTVAERPHDVLVVLAGRTLQQHLLSFHLTLLLQHQQQHLSQATQPSPPAYQITNEILALALLS